MKDDNPEQSLVAKIKEAESYSQEAVVDAQKRKDGIIAKAREQSVFLVKDAMDRLQKERDLKLKAKKEELEKTRAEILNEGAKEEKILEKKFESRKEKAVGFLLEKFGEKA